jgi:hypothetical protein
MDVGWPTYMLRRRDPPAERQIERHRNPRDHYKLPGATTTNITTTTTTTTTNTLTTHNRQSTMVTKTQLMKAALLLGGHPKSVLSEHLRAFIQMYGIASSTDPLIERLCYEILFLDPLMVRHFWRFQAIWGRRDSKDPTHVDWWNQLRAWIRDCVEKARAANIRLQCEMWEAYQDNTPGFYDAPMFDWPTPQADPVARTQWWLQPRYCAPPIIPAHHARGASGSAPGGSTRALRIFLVDPQTHVQPQRPDDYNIWHPDTVEATRNVDALTLPTVFAAILAMCPRVDTCRCFTAAASHCGTRRMPPTRMGRYRQLLRHRRASQGQPTGFAPVTPLSCLRRAW